MSLDVEMARLEVKASEVPLDEAGMYDLARRIGDNPAGLRALVDRYAGSSNSVLVRYVAVPLAHAPWDWDGAEPLLTDIVFDFLRQAGGSDDVSTLHGCQTALQGLEAYRMLRPRSDADRAAIADYLLHCLDHWEVNVRAGALDLLAHLYADGVLEHVLTPDAINLLRRRLARLAAEESDEFGRDLADLRGFW